MADVPITPVAQVVNTRSADLIGAGVTVTTSDTGIIDAKGETRNLVILLQELGSGAATVTFEPGVNPPSMLANADADGLEIALAQGDLRYVPLEPGQFVQADGKIHVTVATNSVGFIVLRDPREK